MKVDLLVIGGKVLTEISEIEMDLAIHDGQIVAMGRLRDDIQAREIIDAHGLIVLPGLVDPHVHFREPGPMVEEDFATGSRAAAAGGVTTVLEQPVDDPPTTTTTRFNEKRALAQDKSYVDFGLWAGLVAENLDELAPMKKAGAFAYKAFVSSSDPLYPMIDDGSLLEAMYRVSALGMLVAVHAESQPIIEYYEKQLYKAIKSQPIDHARLRPPIAELEAIQRCILLAKEAGVRLHVLHLSAAGGADLVADARQRGQYVTVETCPHYLIMTEQALNDYGPYAKCNPPLRDQTNQDALWNALNTGKIDCIVSDHSPYTTEDKARGLEDIRLSPPGINALELGLPLLINTALQTDKITLVNLARWTSTNPAKLFGLYPRKGHIGIGADADLVLIDPQVEWIVDITKLQTKNKWSPYNGWKLKGKVLRTILRGKTIYFDGEFPAGPGYGNFLSPKTSIEISKGTQ